ncbi:COP9 signalosome complex subunit 3 [Clonorchis sinensis]|uniref:COP9 signalosome complex subunit 3 n=1 Tax=Clonorchis sinensis TaxID=79923 RepID=A0A8T1M3V4_CLOSI|nr:COP9 signalosome complex subunit 3 [Clonorchis sinensis]
MIASGLGGFVSAVNKTGGAFNQLKDLVEKSNELLLRHASNLDSIFDSYDIDKYTCLHAGILRAKYLSQLSLDREVLILQTQSFFEQCSVDDARKMSQYVRTISQEFTNRLIAWNVAFRGIESLLIGIKKLQRSPSQLTSLHSDVCQLALSARLFSPVLPLLNVDILEIEKNYSFVDQKDYLLYFYYGGMIYGALKNWERALHFFELCLIIPSFSVSCILVEAAKKVILTSLIHNGKFTTVLKVPTQFVSPRPWKRYCQPYMALATAFQDPNPEALETVIETHRNTFVADHNYGLVKQVAKSYVKFRIHSLTKTFMTMSLADVASRVKLANAQEAEKYLLEMIESKAIFARIDQRNGTVYFQDDPERYNSMEMFMTLQKKIEGHVALEKYLMNVSDELAENPKYAKRMLELESRTAKPSGHY